MAAALNVLMIEDSLSDFLLIERHLKQSGVLAHCSRVSSIKELQDALDMGRWEVVLSDYSVPQMNFLECLNLIRSRLPDVPVILVSGSIGEEKSVELLKQGVCDFVLKGSLARLAPAIERSMVEEAERRARRAAEEALRESQEHLSRAQMLASIGSWRMVIKNGEEVWTASDELYRIYGYPLGFHLTTRSCFDLVHPDDRARIMETWSAAMRGEGPDEWEHRIVVDGQVKWLHVRAYFRFDASGKLVEVAGASQDITERKRAEEERVRVDAQLRQAQKMEALGTLAGGIAHDFNNILMVILGYTEMAQLNIAEGNPVTNELQEVLKAAHRAKELVQQILAFSRRSDQERKSVQVGLIVKEALKMLRASLPATIEIKQSLTSRAVVLSDPTVIHQVLMNLCTNAAHAMRENGGVLAVSLADIRFGEEVNQPPSDLAPGPYVKLTVKDTGHGIEPAVLDRIFDPFFTTKEQGVGTGLGLAVVHGIVKSHEGTIEVESTPGKGTAFYILLPAKESAPLPASEPTVPLPGGKERILVVDDELVLAMGTKRMLEHLGYETDYRTSALDALESFRLQLMENPFDLVITDMTMPHLTGVDLARELYRLKPGLPVIVCTGFSEKINDENAKNIGIQGLLMKPFTLRQLAEMVRKALSESEMGRINSGSDRASGM
jgi:PAS domain S-box-containing protein